MMSLYVRMCSKHDALVLNTLDPIPHKIIQAFIVHVYSIKSVTSFDVDLSVRVVLKQKFQQMLEISMLQLGFLMVLQKILT